MAPDAVLITGKAWIEATFGLLDLFIAKAGVEALAVIAVWQNVSGKIHIKASIQENKAVALAVVPTTDKPQEVIVTNSPADPVPTTETK